MQKSGTWFLEGFTDESRRIWRTSLNALPFKIGRSPDCQLSLDTPSVSLFHAEIVYRHDGLRIVDSQSTNGTFLNDRRIEVPRKLADGDMVRFADWEFRVVQRDREALTVQATEELKSLTRLPGGEFDEERKFREMIQGHYYWAVFQPVVRLSDREVIGYEALGRGLLDGVELPPSRLFAIAEGLGRAAELAGIFRREQLRDAAMLASNPEIFLNTHPAELRSISALVDSLETWRTRKGPLPRLCIEIHETAVMDLGLMGSLGEKLAAMEIGIAFDDFGTGQPRLFELAEISPKYVKFDGVWVQNLDTATDRRLELVRTLVDMVRGQNIVPIAEGVERLEEMEACIEVGFELGQGTYLGAPERASDLASA